VYLSEAPTTALLFTLLPLVSELSSAFSLSLGGVTGILMLSSDVMRVGLYAAGGEALGDPAVVVVAAALTVAAVGVEGLVTVTTMAGATSCRLFQGDTEEEEAEVIVVEEEEVGVGAE
jgi:hypothetical protein